MINILLHAELNYHSIVIIVANEYCGGCEPIIIILILLRFGYNVLCKPGYKRVVDILLYSHDKATPIK